MEDINSKNQNLIYQELSKTFPDDISVLVRLCCHGSELPLGINHPIIVEDLVGKKLNELDFENILLAYVFITAYYFLLDAVVDNHLDNPLYSLYLTHLLTLVSKKIDTVSYSNPQINFDDFYRAFYKLISENAKAICLENEFSSSPYSFSEQIEYQSIVGRSNSSQFLLEIISTLTSSENIDVLKEILRDFAFYVQLGDDLVDWRDDYKSKRYTSFLREIFANHKRILTEGELEEEIYLTSVFELRCIKIIKGFGKIVRQIESISSTNGQLLKILVENQNEQVKNLLTQVIDIKLNVKYM